MRIKLEGTTHYSAINTTNQVVSAAANVNGARIAFAQCYGPSNSSNLNIGGNVFLIANGNNVEAHIEQEIMVPPGLAIDLISSGTGHGVSAWVEVY